MSDITKDDLRKMMCEGDDGLPHHPHCETARLTDEEVDRLVIERAGELGYVNPSDWTLSQALDSWVEHLNAPENRDGALRALLTDKCEACNGNGWLIIEQADFHTGDSALVKIECEECAGRGWLPKTKVVETFIALYWIRLNADDPTDTEDWRDMLKQLLIDWLEAEDVAG